MIDLVWNPLGAFGLVSGALLTALGVFIYAVRSQHERNVFLAVHLALLGMAFVTYNGVRLLAADPADAVALFVTGYAALALALGSYLGFLATLDSPFVSWMRRREVAWSIAGLAALLAAHLLARPAEWVPDVYAFPGYGGWGMRSTPLRDAFIVAVLVSYFLAVAPALHAWHRAPPGILRRQAAVIGIVFATSGASTAAFIAWYFTARGGADSPGEVLTAFLWPALNNIGLVVGLAYGILKFQLFDIDLKIKWTLRRGTLASAFAAAFLIANSIAQQFLEGYGVIVGGAAVGVMLFLVRPIERAADRLVDRAMPSVRDTAEYRTVRKREVYRAAVESALVEGDITAKERGMLAALQDQLGLAGKEAHEIEREARAARAGVT